MRQIVVIHPTRSRYPQSMNTVSSWLNNAGTSIHYVLSVDSDDPICYEKVYPCYVYRNHNKSAIDAINIATLQASKNGYSVAPDCIFVVISDDFNCHENWAINLLAHIGNLKNFCAKTNDALQKTLITLPIFDREFFDDRGYVYFPGYKHLFADQEMTAVAKMTGKFIELPLTFEHLHYSTRKTPKDEINVKNDLTWPQGETLFKERLKTNFGIIDPVMKYEDIVWH